MRKWPSELWVVWGNLVDAALDVLNWFGEMTFLVKRRVAMDTSVRPAGELREEGQGKPVVLAAFHDDQLSEEAGKQLARMLDDPSRKGHKGRDLPTVARDDLLAQLR